MPEQASTEVATDAVRPLRLVIFVQGASYLITGLWPLVHPASFLAVAGPKPDRYQFLATVLLVLAIGAALVVGAWPVRKAVSVDRGVYTLAVAAPAAFVLLYLWVLVEGAALPGVYWIDFGFELVFLVLLAWLGLRARSRTERVGS